MFSSLLDRLGLASAPAAPEPPSGQALAAGAHTWCLAQHGSLLFAGDANGALHAWLLGPTVSLVVGKIDAHEGTIYALTACADFLVSAGADGLCSWRVDGTGSLPKRAVHVAGAPGMPVLALANGDGDVLFSGGADGRVTRWTLGTDGDLSCSAVGSTRSTCGVRVPPWPRTRR